MKTVLVTSAGCAPALAVLRALVSENRFRVIGADSNARSPSSFMEGVEHVVCPPFDSDTYWPFVESLLKRKKVDCVFPTHANEILGWSRHALHSTLRGAHTVFANDPFVVSLCNDKRKTFDWANRVGIRVPEETSFAPCVSRPETGCGSDGVVVTLDEAPAARDGKIIIQRFVDGVEYTIDVLADPGGRVVLVVPKQRIRVKHGQAFESKIRMDAGLIEFATDVSEKLQNRSFINVQAIRERDTGDIYLVEINPRFPTGLPLTVRAGANVPAMMIDSDFSERKIADGLGMVRSYVEHFYVDE